MRSQKIHKPENFDRNLNESGMQSLSKGETDPLLERLHLQRRKWASRRFGREGTVLGRRFQQRSTRLNPADEPTTRIQDWSQLALARSGLHFGGWFTCSSLKANLHVDPATASRANATVPHPLMRFHLIQRLNIRTCSVVSNDLTVDGYGSVVITTKQ